MDNKFYGDNTRWFIGTVVDHVPPTGKEGRVQVRINGVHSSDTSNIPQSHLPWAQVMIPGTEEGTSGLGQSPRLMSGAQVFGVFLDGVDSQYPIVLGSLSKTEIPSPGQSSRAQELEEFDYSIISSAKFSYIDSHEELRAEFASIGRDVTEIVVHWTETNNNKDLSGEDLESMMGGAEIQYHYIIRRDGTIQRGLPINLQGAHTGSSHDNRSIGVIFVGGLNVPTKTDNAVDYKSSSSLTRSQINSFESLVSAFYLHYPGGQVIGFNDLSNNRMDPGFDVRRYCKNVFGKESIFPAGIITRGPLSPDEINNTKLEFSEEVVIKDINIPKTSIVSGVLDFIARYESAGDYTAVYPGKKQPSILNMTLNQLINDMIIRGNTTGSSASGRYQFIRTTLISVADTLGYDFNYQTFNPSTQDELCIQLLKSTCSLDRWLNGSITSREFMIKLSRQWASIPDPDTGVSYYSGVLDNKAGLTSAGALSILEQLQETA